MFLRCFTIECTDTYTRNCSPLSSSRFSSYQLCSFVWGIYNLKNRCQRCIVWGYSDSIAQQLMKLPPLYEVTVSGFNTLAGDEGCSWIVTLVSVMGSPELMTVTAYNGDISAGSGYDVTVGDEYSIIRILLQYHRPRVLKETLSLFNLSCPSWAHNWDHHWSPASAVPDSLASVEISGTGEKYINICLFHLIRCCMLGGSVICMLVCMRCVHILFATLASYKYKLFLTPMKSSFCILTNKHTN